MDDADDGAFDGAVDGSLNDALFTKYVVATEFVFDGAFDGADGALPLEFANDTTFDGLLSVSAFDELLSVSATDSSDNCLIVDAAGLLSVFCVPDNDCSAVDTADSSPDDLLSVSAFADSSADFSSDDLLSVSAFADSSDEFLSVSASADSPDEFLTVGAADLLSVFCVSDNVCSSCFGIIGGNAFMFKSLPNAYVFRA